jgi:hypothetical protein
MSAQAFTEPIVKVRKTATLVAERGLMVPTFSVEASDAQSHKFDGNKNINRVGE